MYFFFGFFIARKLIHLVLKEGIGCRIIIFHRELPSTNQTMYGKKYNRCAILQCKAACSRVLRIHGGCERFDIKILGSNQIRDHLAGFPETATTIVVHFSVCCGCGERF